MELKIKNNIIQWQELVGYEHNKLGYQVLCWEYSQQDNKLKIAEYHDDTSYTNEVVLNDLERALKQLELLGFEIKLTKVFSFAQESIVKAQALIIAGFFKLMKSGEEYMVDGIFPQSFLSEEEAQYLLKNEVREIKLEDIK